MSRSPFLRTCSLLVLLTCLPMAVWAESVSLNEAWARATRPSGTVGAAYLTISNASAEDRAVVAGSATGAGRIELHTHIIEDDVMRMVEIPEIPLPAGEATILKPGDLHIMLYELTGPLRVGESFELTLELDDGTSLKTKVIIGSATARDYAEATKQANDADQAGQTATEDAADCCGAGS